MRLLLCVLLTGLVHVVSAADIAYVLTTFTSVEVSEPVHTRLVECTSKGVIKDVDYSIADVITWLKVGAVHIEADPKNGHLIQLKLHDTLTRSSAVSLSISPLMTDKHVLRCDDGVYLITAEKLKSLLQKFGNITY